MRHVYSCFELKRREACFSSSGVQLLRVSTPPKDIYITQFSKRSAMVNSSAGAVPFIPLLSENICTDKHDQTVSH